MALVLGISLSSCSDLLGPDKTSKIPYGYDPTFNYLSVLKASPPYAYESVDRLPLFTYQDSSDTNLRTLRERYRLTEIAGNGDELSRILNLLGWAHDSLRHDGSVRVEPENSLRILQYHEESGKGVNCVMMAIVLNEAYLAMGFASRVIHGNARDWVFNGEWHTFNAVYASTLGKWVFVDPMMKAHFTSSSGVDHLVLNEAESTLPLFLEDLKNGCPQRIYTSGERPDIGKTPIPMWSLIKPKRYTTMSIQYSRGCPFDCEFCDIIVLNGNRPRTKTKEQLMAELDALYNQGWRETVFLVDDNFIGNKRKLKDEILPAMIKWQIIKNTPSDFSRKPL